MPNYIDDYPYLNIPDFSNLINQLNPNNNYIGVCVRYTTRRNMELNVYSDGRIVLKCPADADIESIENYICGEETWIIATLTGNNRQ